MVFFKDVKKNSECRIRVLNGREKCARVRPKFEYFRPKSVVVRAADLLETIKNISFGQLMKFETDSFPERDFD